MSLEDFTKNFEAHFLFSDAATREKQILVAYDKAMKGKVKIEKSKEVLKDDEVRPIPVQPENPPDVDTYFKRKKKDY